jgi:hypothetical protein
VGNLEEEKKYARHDLALAVTEGGKGPDPSYESKGVSRKIYAAIRRKGPEPKVLSGEERAERIWLWLDYASDMEKCLFLNPAKMIIPFTRDNVRWVLKLAEETGSGKGKASAPESFPSKEPSAAGKKRKIAKAQGKKAQGKKAQGKKNLGKEAKGDEPLGDKRSPESISKANKGEEGGTPKSPDPSLILDKLVFSLPPITFPPNDKILFCLIEEYLKKKAVKEPWFMIANLGQIALLTNMPHRVRLVSDNCIPIFNHLAANALLLQGVSSVTLTEEIDNEGFKFINNSRFEGGKFLFYLAGRPPLCFSRMRPFRKGAPFVSNKGEIFTLKWVEEGYSVLRSETRYFLSSIFGKETSPDLLGFIVDLRDEDKPVTMGEMLVKAIKSGESLKDSPFKFKTELAGFSFNPKRR